MAKAAGAKLRALGAVSSSTNWAERAAVCEGCPLRVVRGGVSYCGTPFLQKIDREPAVDGCGCPTRDKAKSPGEHCPLDARQRPAMAIGSACTCKWCALTHL
ncbi:MAG TPA: hypothetical protein VLI90_03955 [Tepidisphaeraceae bacterium]|nr:hypothetical protein [Tepidisphaeraceae bacterium]